MIRKFSSRNKFPAIRYSSSCTYLEKILCLLHWMLKTNKFCRLSDAKQSRVYLPEAPFPHDGYVKSGRLKCFTTTHGEVFS